MPVHHRNFQDCVSCDLEIFDKETHSLIKWFPNFKDYVHCPTKKVTVHLRWKSSSFNKILALLMKKMALLLNRVTVLKRKLILRLIESKITLRWTGRLPAEFNVNTQLQGLCNAFGGTWRHLRDRRSRNIALSLSISIPCWSQNGIWENLYVTPGR